MNMLSTTDATVVELFKKFEASGLCYAVLRNYENYPNFSHDIDLVMQYSNIPEARRIIAETAQAFKWDSAHECAHWNQSLVPIHKIEVFKLYSLDELEYLQIDLFHGMALLGIPFLTEQELLLDRIKDPRGFWRISKGNENLIRLMQLSRIPPDTEKYNKYLQALRKYAGEHEGEFTNEVNLKLGKYGLLALKDLLNKDHAQARIKFRWLRIKFILKAFQKLGIPYVISTILQRFLSQWGSFIGNPCGFILTVDPKAQMSTLTDALEILQTRNWLILWSKSNSRSPFLTWADRQVLERGGIILKQTRLRPHNFSWNTEDSTDVLLRRIAILIMSQHPAIFGSKELEL